MNVTYAQLFLLKGNLYFIIPAQLVGWQATQKLNFNNTIRKMKLDGGVCLFGCLGLGLSMLWRPIRVQFPKV